MQHVDQCEPYVKSLGQGIGLSALGARARINSFPSLGGARWLTRGHSEASGLQCRDSEASGLQCRCLKRRDRLRHSTASSSWPHETIDCMDPHETIDCVDQIET